MLPITKLPLQFKITPVHNRDIYHIVIHETGDFSKTATARAFYKGINRKLGRKASADFFVDDSEIVQYNPDLKNYYTWHCGDGKGKYGITNTHSIGIEICVNKGGDYEKAKANAVLLVVDLMKTYKVPFKNVVRHYDASHKICPNGMSKDNWKSWYEFKDKIETLSIEKPKKYGVVTASALNIRYGAGTQFKIFDTVPKGTKLEILNIGAEDWCKVSYKNAEVYVNKKYLEVK